jgi:hypothetical protein
MSKIIHMKLLGWKDLLEDGNLLWEICLTESPIWIEPDRWHQTVCNFLELLAYERNIEGTERLFPTARLQIVRDLYFSEWQARAVPTASVPQSRLNHASCTAPARPLLRTVTPAASATPLAWPRPSPTPLCTQAR